jgi:hypothetical protein
VFSATKLDKAAFKLAFFRDDPRGQNVADFLMEGPEIIQRHGPKVQLFHWFFDRVEF